MDQSDNNNQPTVPPTSVAAQQDPQMNATPPSGAANSSIPTQTQQENISQTDNNQQVTVPSTPAVEQQDQPFVANQPAVPVSSQDQQENAGVSAAQQSDSTTNVGDTPQEEDYVTNVGLSMIDLFTDISMSEGRKQKVAEAMKISVAQVTTIVEQLLDKIDNEQITEEELVFIISSSVADEFDDLKNP